MKILIVYGTTEGHTRKVAQRVSEYIESAGHTAVLVDSADKQSSIDLTGYDALIIAGSVHQGHYQGSLTYFISSHLEEIKQLPSALLSINLSMVTSADSEEADTDVRKLVEDTSWNPDGIKLVAGALKYSQYDFFKRQTMKLLAKRRDMPSNTEEDYEFTNWADLRVFIDTFILSKVAGEVT